MKKFLLVLVLLAAGHYGAWHYISTQAEKNFNMMVVEKTRHSIGTFDYTLKKSGYPSKISFEISDMRFTAPDAEMSLYANSDNGIKISVPFSLNPDTFIIDSSGIDYTIAVNSPEGDFAIDMAIGEGKSTITQTGEIYTVEGFLDDLTFGIALPEGEVGMHIASIDMKETTRVMGGKIDSHVEVKMTDGLINVNAGGEEISFNVDNYVIKGGLKNFPDTLDNFSQKVMPLIDQANAGEESLELADFKVYLKDLIGKMADNKSIIYFDELSYQLSGLPEIGSFGFNMGAKFSVAQDRTLRGSINVKLDGLNQIAESMMKQDPSGEAMQNMPPFALGLMQAGTVELSAKIDNNGMLVFNGMPVFPVPPLDDLIDGIPDTVEAPTKQMQ
jgi:hypothetical protein